MTVINRSARRKIDPNRRTEGVPTRRGRTRGRRRLRAAVLAVSLVASTTGLMTLGATTALAADAQTTQGTDFWVTFEGNYDGGSSLYLFAAGDTATTGAVSIPGISFSATFTVTPGVVTKVDIPNNAQDFSSDVVGNMGIHVVAQDPVAVYGLNTEQYTTDGFLGLPTNILGAEYIVQAYTNDIGYGSQFSVIGTQDNTTVTITPSENVSGHTAGTPYTVSLNQGQTYQLNDSLISGGDLTGTFVAADHPVAVFAGSRCVNVPQGYVACNTIAEQMTPTNAWGESFITEPLATRHGDTFRFLASQDNTTVSVNGSPVATLNKGKYFETVLTAASVVTADNPIHVMQYSNGQQFDGANADPFDITIAPYAQFLNKYTITTVPEGANPAITDNYVNIVAPTSVVGAITLDGTAIPADSFTAIPGSSFSGAQVHVGFGSHVLDGPLPFGITVYGFGGYDGYGYPGGFTLSPIATVSNVALSLAGGGTGLVGTQACASATVTDQNNNPLSGVRADFTVTGANPNSGFAYTDTSGVAQYCYVGSTAGNDSIVAAVQSLQSNAATWVWTSKATNPPTANPQSVTTPQNTPVAITLTGADPDGDSLTYAASTPAHGTLSGTAPNLTYTPATDYTGTDSFTFTTSDGSLTSSAATVDITVTPTTPSCAAAPAVDVQVSADQKTAAAKLTSPKFSTAGGNELILAFVEADGPQAPTQQVSKVTGGGLTWTLAARSNKTWGTTEVWQAYATSKLTNAVVTASLDKSGFDGSITVAAFTGSAKTVGATASASDTKGAPSAKLVPAGCNSLIWAAGHDWSTAATPVAAGGQTLVHTFVDKRVNDSFWVQKVDTPTKAGEPVTVADTAPTKDRWTLAAVEIPAA